MCRDAALAFELDGGIVCVVFESKGSPKEKPPEWTEDAMKDFARGADNCWMSFMALPLFGPEAVCHIKWLVSRNHEQVI